jgi:peroxiredoxin
MNKLSLLIILLAALWGCQSKSGKAKISGELTNAGNDTIYLYGTDELTNLMDTVYVTNNEFSHSLETDTLASGVLLFTKSNKKIPFYFNKGDKVTLSGDLEHPVIQGNVPNEQLTAFLQSIRYGSAPQSEQLKQAEAFIRSNTDSKVCVYIIKNYFLKAEKPDYKKIKELIGVLTGPMRDDPYIYSLSEQIDKQSQLAVGNVAPYFSLPDVNGKRVARSDIKDKYILLNFWASWSAHSRKEYASLRKLHKTYGSKSNFTQIGISVDVDKETWKLAVKADTLNWQQLCDLGGWESPTVKQFMVRALPTYYLLAPDGKIVLQSNKSSAVEAKLKELLTK